MILLSDQERLGGRNPGACLLKFASHVVISLNAVQIMMNINHYSIIGDRYIASLCGWMFDLI